MSRRWRVPVLEHRLILRPEFEIEGMTPAEAVEENSRKRGGAGVRLVPSARLIWLVALVGFPRGVVGAVSSRARGGIAAVANPWR